MTEAFLRAYYEAYNSGQEARLAEFLAVFRQERWLYGLGNVQE